MGKLQRRLLQDLVGRAQLPVLTLQLLDLGLFGAATLGLLTGLAVRLDALLAMRTEENPSRTQINPCALSLVWSARYSSVSRAPSARCAAVCLMVCLLSVIGSFL